jgi:hypothetical protein
MQENPMKDDRTTSYHVLLDLLPTATETDIKKGWHEQVQVWNPDRFTHTQAFHRKAQARPHSHSQPFLLWVTFSDGTSQETIDQLVREMHGNKGALSEGWQAVEIVPPTEREDRFLEQI